VHYFPRDYELLFGPVKFDVALLYRRTCLLFPFPARTYDTNAGLLRGRLRIALIRSGRPWSWHSLALCLRADTRPALSVFAVPQTALLAGA